MPRYKNGLSPKQSIWIAEFIKTNNATEAARRAGYKGSNRQMTVVGCQNVVKLSPYIRDHLDNVLLSDDRLDMLLAEALGANETKFFAHEGEIVDQVDVINWSARLKALGMANRIKGRFVDNIKINGKLTLEALDDKTKERYRRQSKLDAVHEVRRLREVNE